MISYRPRADGGVSILRVLHARADWRAGRDHGTPPRRLLASDAAARATRYNPRLYLAPFWAEIYTCDAERQQDPAVARATEAVMRDTNADDGYELVEPPRARVAERTAFVRARV